MPYPPVRFPLVPKSNAIRRRATRSIHGGKGCSRLQRRRATHFLSTLVDTSFMKLRKQADTKIFGKRLYFIRRE